MKCMLQKRESRREREFDCYHLLLIFVPFKKLVITSVDNNGDRSKRKRQTRKNRKIVGGGTKVSLINEGSFSLITTLLLQYHGSLTFIGNAAVVSPGLLDGYRLIGVSRLTCV